jgi:hypothetical protein
MPTPKGTKLVLTGLLAFTCSYVGASFLWFQPTFGTIIAVLRLALPPTVEHTSAEAAFSPGTRLDLSVISHEVRLSRERQSKRFVLTAFDTNCRFASASVPFWNRLTEALEADNVNHVILACGPSRSDLQDFIARSMWTARVSYAGPCEEVAGRLGMRLGLVQYVVNDEWRVVSAWVGKPTRRYVERDRIVQIRRTATSAE